KTLEKLRGMWAFALYDQNTRRLTLSRDRFGIKPLYYHAGKNRFIFASEIKALLVSQDVPRKACLPVLADYLVAGFSDHRPETFFQGIMQLPPGHTLEMETATRSFKISRYYDLGTRLQGRSTDVAGYGAAFREAIRLHLRSDVPVGTCLSGGLDSSSVASTAAAFMHADGLGPFQAVTAQSGDPRNDETAYARQIVENSGLRWHLAAPTAEDFRKHWERCLWHQEEPTGGPSVFMQYWVMKTAKEAGLIVMLDGQGGDETLLGYERYYPTLLLEWLRRSRFGTAASEFLAATCNSKLSIKDLALYSIYFLTSGPRKLRLKNRFPDFPPELLEQTFSQLDELTRAFQRPDAMQAAEMTRFQLPHLLKYEDRNSMAWSVEARVPLVDHELAEAALLLRPEDKIRGGYTKWALRKTMEGKMPDSITWRRNKIG
ncbi:MAG TPA: asparagine synthase (glutamine-hydrolyzing), partial [Elusimicrobiales bacterium]|nr:asparagine synthase (glutamine-hydrolyzing) [Elusimicrobiales bacterium]